MLLKKKFVLFKKFYIDILVFIFALILIILLIDKLSIKLILIGVLWLMGIFKIFNEMKFSHEIKLLSYMGEIFEQQKFNKFEEIKLIETSDISDNHRDKEKINYINKSNIDNEQSNDVNNKATKNINKNKKNSFNNIKSNPKKSIQGIVMLSEEGMPIDEWDIFGKISLIIGKENNEYDVDIDLSKSAYASFIDVQHAILNYYNGAWHIEDYYSDNGVSIEKGSKVFQLSPKEPCKIDVGDIIYIANTKLLVV